MPSLEPRRHEKVAGSLGRRLAHDRRLDVDEALGLHLLADDRDELRPRADVSLQLVPAEVEPAIAEAQRLVDVLLVELERERRARRDDVELVDLELDLAGRQVRVDVLRRARGDLALRAKHELVADVVRGRGRLRRALGVDDELADPRRVAEVDEDEPAVVAAPRDPAGERVSLSDVLGPELAGSEVAPAHRLCTASASDGNSSSFSPARRTVAPSARTITVTSAPSRPACVSCPFSERPA